MLAVGQVTQGDLARKIDRMRNYLVAKAVIESSNLPIGFQATKRVLELMKANQGGLQYLDRRADFFATSLVSLIRRSAGRC
jgi:hypothetical protein